MVISIVKAQLHKRKAWKDKFRDEAKSYWSYTSELWLWSHIGFIAVKLPASVELCLLNTTIGRNRLWSKLIRDKWQSAIAFIDLALTASWLQAANTLDSLPLASLGSVTIKTWWNLALSCKPSWLKSYRESLLGLVLNPKRSSQGMFSLAELHVMLCVQGPPLLLWGFVCVWYAHCLQAHKVTSSSSSS